MPARNRTRNSVSVLTGRYRRNYTPWYTGSVQVGLFEVCSDTVGNPHGDNPFSLSKKTYESCSLDGFEPRFDNQGNPAMTYESYPCPNFLKAPPAMASYLPELSALQLNEYAWESYARSNPSRSLVSIPTFIAELKDLPSMIRTKGNSILRAIASGYLAYQWGWKPLVNDLLKMINFVEAAQKRFRLMKHLRDGGTVRRRQTLSNRQFQLPEGPEYWLHTSAAIVTGRDTIFGSEEIWSTCRYDSKGHSARFPQTDEALLREATLNVMGVTSWGALKALWEILPWSWFVDWYLGVGTVLEATDNSIPMNRVSCCLMHRRLIARKTRIINKPSWMKVTGHIYQGEEVKKRLVIAPSLPVVPRVPIIDARRFAILASLTVLKTFKTKQRQVEVWGL